MTAAHQTSPVQTDRYREQARSHSFDWWCSRILCPSHIPCGSEPARDDGGPSNITGSDRPLSRASSLPQFWLVVFTNFVPVTHPPVGASLLAMTAAHQTSPVQTDRYREQARSHSFGWWCSRILCPPHIPCGSEPARDDGGPSNITGSDRPLSRAGSLPQFFGGVHGFCVRHTSPVGASLLAMTAAHSTSPVQTDRYREQARSHSFDWWCSRILCPPQNPCGSEPARDDGGTFSITGSDRPLSRASSLPQF
ncbi:hypothetical protein SAMN05216504_5345 [Pseudomonas sp. A214]|nr:hypothetical protein SAMN05216504_5345 [Pseudomonas sp. A214]